MPLPQVEDWPAVSLRQPVHDYFLCNKVYKKLTAKKNKSKNKSVHGTERGTRVVTPPVLFPLLMVIPQGFANLFSTVKLY